MAFLKIKGIPNREEGRTFTLKLFSLMETAQGGSFLISASHQKQGNNSPSAISTGERMGKGGGGEGGALPLWKHSQMVGTLLLKSHSRLVWSYREPGLDPGNPDITLWKINRVIWAFVPDGWV